ncbi:unnamed protein product [Rhizoctonia solani]|uniref:Uncharacterized protein n=1 Tax=Rhizoctonia solani TaxID=456999 RepID=A0A8H3I2E8_9AGAM|nr:unnamed protein product [Rhizoctonia solani]
MLLTWLILCLEAWLKLDVGEPIVRSLGSSRGPLWDLREGFYIKGFSRSEEHFADTIQFIPLDADTPDPPPIEFDFGFREFTADPGQGLIALISNGPEKLVCFIRLSDPTNDRSSACYIHLCSSITGLAHPLAEQPRLTTEFTIITPSFFSFSIEIMKHMLLAKLSDLGSKTYEVLIWDWKTGTLLHRIYSQEGMCDFTFLDERHLALLTCDCHSTQDDLALLIYDISNGSPTHVAPPNDQSQPNNALTTQPILRLELPRLQESSRISETGFLLRSGPTPGRMIHTKSAAFSYSHATTLNMTFGFRPWGPPISYRVFIDGRSLLNHLNIASRNGAKVLPWATWGPNATRWFTVQRESGRLLYWPYCMAGSKYTPQLSHLRYCCIFDFSSLTISRSIQLAKLHPNAFLVDDDPVSASGRFANLNFSDGYLTDFISELPPRSELYAVVVGSENASIIEAGSSPESGFSNSFTSRLPFRFVCRETSLSHKGWQILEDCIVGVGSEMAQTSSRSITIYKLNQ